MFVRPEQVAAVVKRHPEVVKARLVVEREDVKDVMTLQCEVDGPGDGLVDAVKGSIQEVCKLKGEVLVVSVGELASDGKVIEDLRSYE